MEISEIHEEWGRRIRRARRAKDETAVSFAASVGISRTHLHRLEAGQQAPSDAVRVRIAEALAMKPEELFSYDLRDAS
jgi:transcriptional regulator with XRE-family HTH domain